MHSDNISHLIREMELYAVLNSISWSPPVDRDVILNSMHIRSGLTIGPQLLSLRHQIVLVTRNVSQRGNISEQSYRYY